MIDWKIFLTIATAALAIIFVMAIAVIAKERFFKRSPAPAPAPIPAPSPSPIPPPPPPTSSSSKINLWRDWLGFPVIGLTIGALLVGITYWYAPNYISPLGTPLHPWLLVLFGFGFLLFGRVQTVEQDQLGVKTMLGMVIQTFGPGPTFVPVGLCKLTKLPANQFSIQIGASETAPTMHLLDGLATAATIEQCQESLEVNFATPEQAKWTLDEVEERQIREEDAATIEKVKERRALYLRDSINTRLTAKMRITFLVQIDPGATREFAKNIVAPERAILELNELARAVVGRWCGKRTPAFVTRNLGLLGREILHNAEDLVGDAKPAKVELADGTKVIRHRDHINPQPWGLDIIRTEVHSPTFPEEVRTAIASVAKNIADGEALSRLADGEKEKRIKEGAGAAEARKSMLFAEAGGAEEFARICKDSPTALALATLKAQENIAKEADFIIAPDADLVGLLAKGRKVLDTIGKGGTR